MKFQLSPRLSPTLGDQSVTTSCSGLPPGWAVTTLDSLSVLLSTSNKKTLTKDSLPIGKYPVVDQGRGSSPGYVDEESLVVAATDERPVIVFGDHTRVFKFVTYPFVPGADGTKLIRPLNEWHAKFAFYSLCDAPLPNRGYGRHFRYLRSATLRLAPYPEQQRIADKLDTVLARVDACRDRLARVAPLLKRFRQSVLSAATSGRLTESWRATENAQLLEKTGLDLLIDLQASKRRWLTSFTEHNEASRIEKRFDAFRPQSTLQEGFPLGWVCAHLEDTVLMVVDCHNKTAPYENDGIPLVRTTNVRDGKFVWDDLRYVSEATCNFWSRRCPPEPGDLVFTREAPMGEVAIIPAQTRICLGQRTMLIRPIQELVPARFLQICLMDPSFRQRSEASAVGSGVKHFRVGDVSELVVPVPPLPEQAEIVRRVDILFAFADRLEARLTQAQTAVDRLTPSLLAKAFRGELVPQDPADEPATELLKRLQSTAAERPAAGRPRRRAAAASP